MKLIVKGSEVSSEDEVSYRLSMFLWGPSGSGKTTLAATAPGNKLLLNFDPDGHTSLAGRNDVFVVDMASERPAIVGRLKKEQSEVTIDGKNVTIKQLLENNPSIQTVIFDTLTTYAELCIADAVNQPVVRGKGESSICVEAPSQAGYAYKNSSLLQTVQSLLRITGSLKRNIIFIGHEGPPNRNKDGHIVSIPVLLSESIQSKVPLQISEVWAVADQDKKRTIAIRPCRFRSPMKTRMFISNGAPEFQWKYDPTTNEGEGIASWYDRWKASGFAKIAVPT